MDREEATSEIRSGPSRTDLGDLDDSTPPDDPMPGAQ
jgi:hypothetical protein